MEHNYIYIVLLIAFLTSCAKNAETNKSQLENFQTLEFDLKAKTQSIHDLRLIKDVEIISLECDNVIGQINKTIRFGDKIYILDLFQGMCVHVFSTDGRFINTISKYGQGPNEYLQLFDIFINKEDSTLNLLTRIDRKLFKYDLEGENLIRIESLPKSFTSMLKSVDGYIGYMGGYFEDPNNPNDIWLLDENYKPIESCFSIDDTSKGQSIEGYSLSSFDSNFYFIKKGDFNVYSINDADQSIKYFIKMNGKERSEQAEGANMIANDNYVDRLYNFQETNNYVLVSFIFNGNYLVGVYSKKDEKTSVVNLSSYKGKYFIPFGKIISYDENAIYAIVSASSMIRYWEGKDDYNDFWKDYPEQIKNLRSKFKSIDEEDNPFLIIYSFDEKQSKTTR
jgi:hypothetical protein